jgi:hypothetical protein
MFLFKIVKNMGRTSLSLNASFVVALLNGFVGEILTFVTLAIKDNVQETMYQNTQKTSCLNVEVLANVLWEVIMMETENKRCWDVQYAGIINKTIKVSDCM